MPRHRSRMDRATGDRAPSARRSFSRATPEAVCPVGGQHEANTAHDWTLIHNSPYHEAETNWRWCNRCKGLFWAGFNDGICPAGGAHNKTGSGNYSVAFELEAL